MVVNEFSSEHYSRGRLVRAIQASLADDENSDILQEINEIFGGAEIYLVGNRIRDALINNIHDRELPHLDYDLWVDDSSGEINFYRLLADHPDVVWSPSGYPTLEPKPGLQFDVKPLSNCNLRRLGKPADISIRSTLIGSDLTTSSLAYRLNDSRLFDFRGIGGVEQRVVDINFQEARPDHVLMARSLLHALRLKFRLGGQAVKLIRANYDQRMKVRVAAYLQEQGQGNQTEKILDWLKYISGKS